MAQFTMISGAKLLPTLKKLVKTGRAFHDGIHQFAVSALFHACKSGDTRPLNTFFTDVLSVNYQTAFRQYLSRIYRDWPDAKCVAFSQKDGFTIGGSDQANRDNLAGLCESTLLNPDGKKVMRFYERNVIKEHMMFGDVEFAAQVASLLKKATTSTDDRTSNVDKHLTDALANVVNLAKARAEAQKSAGKARKAA